MAVIMGMKLRRRVTPVLCAFSLLASAPNALAETVSLVCSGTHHIQVDLNTHSVIDSGKPYPAEITDTQVKWDYIFGLIPAWRNEPAQGPHNYYTLDRDTGILVHHSNAGQGSGANSGIRWGPSGGTETCVKANKIF